MSIMSVILPNHLILCGPLPLLPSIFPSTRVFPMSQFFPSGGQKMSFSFNISLSNEHSRLISLRMDWLDLLDVQGTLNSLLPHHSSKASVLLCSGHGTGHRATDWFQIGKGVHQGCILSPCLFNLYAECIMRNAGLDEAQAGIKISGRNINNGRDADGTTLMAESKEELKSLLMSKNRRVK